MGIAYTAVAIPNETYELVPDPDLAIGEKVYVCGAIKMAEIARRKGWTPGSFLNEQFAFDAWLNALGSELLNSSYTTGLLRDVVTPCDTRFFIRPAEDNKAFDGTVMDAEMLAGWRQDAVKRKLLNLPVIVSPVKEIYREYRLFVVKNEVVTGSVYKVGGRPQLSDDVEEYVLDYARSVIAKWVPAESCVVDVALTSAGLKIIEFNNINSSGFYASDIAKYVQAIQEGYA